jgi:hypothetical protein
VRGKSSAPRSLISDPFSGDKGKGQLREPTKEEKTILKETEDEFKRRNFFKRIFPSIDYLYYKQFFTEDRPLNAFVDSRLMAQFRDNNPQMRMQYEKMPRFLMTIQTSLVKQHISPVSGSNSIRVQAEQLLENYRVEKPQLALAHSFN